MKYKYIIHWFYTPRDHHGNAYSYFRFIDVKSGKRLEGTDVDRADLFGAVYHLNGGGHKQNYYFAETSLNKLDFKVQTQNIQYVGCESAVIAEKFKKLLRSRKKILG